LNEYSLVLVHTKEPIAMNEVIRPWICGESFTPGS